jgi:hypothetical protein
MILLLAAARGLPHLAQDDASCARAEAGADLPHDASAHAMRAATDAAAPERHCAVCHFIRSLRSPLVVLDAGAVQLSPPELAHPASARVTLPPVLEHLPARAPPSA